MQTHVELKMEENKETGEWTAIAKLPKEVLDEAKKEGVMNHSKIFELFMLAYISGYLHDHETEVKFLCYVLELIQKTLIVARNTHMKSFNKAN